MKNDVEIGAQPARIVTEDSTLRESRFLTPATSTSSLERSVIEVEPRGITNMMIVKIDVDEGCKWPKPGERKIATTPRLPSPTPHAAHTKAVVSFTGSRCTVIIETGADVSVVSA